MLPGEQIWNELKPILSAVHSTEPLVLAQAELGPADGGPPISRILAYAATEPTPHWHLVTCGLSASRFIPGYPDVGGIELSFRLARGASDQRPPAWVPGFFEALGREAFASDRPISNGSKVQLADLWQALDTSLTAGICIDDPATSAAAIKLVQLVGLTGAERDRVWMAKEKAKLLFELTPLGITDPARVPRPPPAAAAPRPARPAPPAVPRFETITVTKMDGRMRLAVSVAEATPLADVLVEAIRVGSLSFSVRGWSINITIDEIPRSATWATTLAMYFTIDGAKQAAAELKDPARYGQALRWPTMPDLEMMVMGAPPKAEAPAETPTFGSRLKKFFGS
jgi:hypothetical protein